MSTDYPGWLSTNYKRAYKTDAAKTQKLRFGRSNGGMNETSGKNDMNKGHLLILTSMFRLRMGEQTLRGSARPVCGCCCSSGIRTQHPPVQPSYTGALPSSSTVKLAMKIKECNLLSIKPLLYIDRTGDRHVPYSLVEKRTSGSEVKNE